MGRGANESRGASPGPAAPIPQPPVPPESSAPVTPDTSPSSTPSPEALGGSDPIDTLGRFGPVTPAGPIAQPMDPLDLVNPSDEVMDRAGLDAQWLPWCYLHEARVSWGRSNRTRRMSCSVRAEGFEYEAETMAEACQKVQERIDRANARKERSVPTLTQARAARRSR